jgi:hypothetical protein
VNGIENESQIRGYPVGGGLDVDVADEEGTGDVEVCDVAVSKEGAYGKLLAEIEALDGEDKKYFKTMSEKKLKEIARLMVDESEEEEDES